MDTVKAKYNSRPRQKLKKIVFGDFKYISTQDLFSKYTSLNSAKTPEEKGRKNFPKIVSEKSFSFYKPKKSKESSPTKISDILTASLHQTYESIPRTDLSLLRSTSQKPLVNDFKLGSHFARHGFLGRKICRTQETSQPRKIIEMEVVKTEKQTENKLNLEGYSEPYLRQLLKKRNKNFS